MEWQEQDLIYGHAGELALEATLYLPESRIEPGPVVIEVHGGAWSSGNRKAGKHYIRELAKAGIVVLSIDFRQGPDFKHPSASADVACAVRYVRVQAENWGVGISSLGLIGSSSGGHLAMLASLKPEVAEHCTSIPVGVDGNPTAAVDWVIALWPVSNPLARYQYVLARLPEAEQTRPIFQPDRLEQAHRGYYASLEDMEQASIQRILAAGEQQCLPNLFIVQPELDQNVPVFMSQTLKGAWEHAGGSVQYKLYEGVGHAFAHREGPQTAACIEDMKHYIKEWRRS